MIVRNGGNVLDDKVEIKYQNAQTVRFEESFEGVYPKRRIFNAWADLWKGFGSGRKEFKETFTGSAVVLSGRVGIDKSGMPHNNLTIDVYLNDELVETVVMAANETIRKHDIYWNYELPEKEYEMRQVPRDFPEGYYLVVNTLVIYSNTDPGPQIYF